MQNGVVEQHVTVEAFDMGQPSLASNTSLKFVSDKPCLSMDFDVTSDGSVAVETLCSAVNNKKQIDAFVGENITLSCTAEGKCHSIRILIPLVTDIEHS